MPRWLKLISVVLIIAMGLLIASPIRNTLPVLATSTPVHVELPPFVVSLQGGNISADGRTNTQLQNDTVSLVKSMRSGTATVIGSSIEVRGVATINGDWAAALSSFRERVPAGTALTVDVFIIDESLSVAQLCRKMFASISGIQIEFRQSGSELRSSSFVALDRLISFAHDCPDNAIHIIGHSDASGGIEFNQALSQRRAQAVADYLYRGGVTLDRLLVAGKGSAEPVADNSTARGRARNRRIELALWPLTRR